MDTVLLPLTRSPHLPKYVEELRALLQDEAAQRQKFRDWLDEDKKAEFINGEIVVHSPAKLEHTDSQLMLARLLSAYVDLRRLGKVLHEKALIELTRNDYEPDICFWTSAKSNLFQPKQMVFPPPDLAVEILSPSTEHLDRGAKFQDFAAHGTSEYWIIDPAARQVEQYRLEGTTYVESATGGVGDTLISIVVEGFNIPIEAVFDVQANLDALRKLFA